MDTTLPKLFFLRTPFSMSQTQLAHIKHEPHNPVFNFICVKSQTPLGTAFPIQTWTKFSFSKVLFKSVWERNTLETDKRRLKRQKNRKTVKLFEEKKKSVLYLITGNITTMLQHCKKFSFVTSGYLWIQSLISNTLHIIDNWVTAFKLASNF